MCSIMGYCDVCADTEAFTRGFLQTVSRGPDDSRIVDVGRGLLGFHRPMLAFGAFLHYFSRLKRLSNFYSLTQPK